MDADHRPAPRDRREYSQARNALLVESRRAFNADPDNLRRARDRQLIRSMWVRGAFAVVDLVGVPPRHAYSPRSDLFVPYVSIRTLGHARNPMYPVVVEVVPVGDGLPFSTPIAFVTR